MADKNFSGPIRFVRKADQVIGKAESFIAGLCFVAMTLLVLAGILTRFVLHIPFMWVEEAARYLMVTGVYIGISMAVRDRAHLGLTGVVDALPPKVGRVIKIISEVISIAAYVLFFIFSVQFAAEVRLLGQKTPALRYPMWIIYIPLIVGFLLSAIRAIMVFWNDYIAKEKTLPDSHDEILSA